eukprot:CAMPEP_0179922814 /NCGR_PEP_ID=MMETSP0983-20121128/5854_1 /TAXON_ID=483367 /ORGANISM="non described non described, Strain CCMP 2436" /LENGTH=201 /DNA_ID=CAMNT_0021826215 /DNA_START=135 /DNA_END=741 /DNA_ORIENTATION=-
MGFPVRVLRFRATGRRWLNSRAAGWRVRSVRADRAHGRGPIADSEGPRGWELSALLGPSADGEGRRGCRAGGRGCEPLADASPRMHPSCELTGCAAAGDLVVAYLGLGARGRVPEGKIWVATDVSVVRPRRGERVGGDLEPISELGARGRVPEERFVGRWSADLVDCRLRPVCGGLEVVEGEIEGPAGPALSAAAEASAWL